MRYYSYNEPIWSDNDERDEYGHIKILGHQVVTKSEDDIRAEYFPHWKDRMIQKFGKEKYDSTYGFEECLDDWVIVNWAWESHS